MKKFNYYADLMKKYQTPKIEKDIHEILKIKKEFPIVFDVGSNIGSFTKELSKHIDYNEFHLFEPSTQIYNYSIKNLENVKNVIINNKGISNKNEEKILYKCPQLNKKIRTVGILEVNGKDVLKVRGCGGESNIGWNTMFTGGDLGQKYTDKSSGIHGFYKFMDKENVSCISIDNYVKQNKLSSIDLIKIDVEGYEGPVLEGALESIKLFKPLLLVEICWGKEHPEWNNNKIIYEKILNMGYKTVNCNNLLNEGFNGDLIFQYIP